MGGGVALATDARGISNCKSIIEPSAILLNAFSTSSADSVPFAPGTTTI